MNTTRKLQANHRGAGLVEYGLLVGLISVLAIGAVLATGEEIDETFITVGDELELARLIATAERRIEILGGDIFPAQDCRTGNPGAQSIATGDADASGYDCYDLGGGGDLLSITNAEARSIAWYVHDGNNKADLPQGNHVILFGSEAFSGVDRVTSAGGAGIVSMAGISTGDVDLVVEADRMRILHGSKELNLLNAFSPSAPFNDFRFTDASMDLDAIRVAALDHMSDDNPNTITGSSFADKIYPGAGFDTVVPYGGDDTIFFTSGNMIIPGGVEQGAGFDTLDISGYASTEVTVTESYGTLSISIAPTGETIQIYSQYGLPDLNINRIVFSDSTLEEADLNAIP